MVQPLSSRCISLQRIVVLEDDERLREHILLPKLRERGFDPIGVASAAELYRSMLQYRFDLALLNIDLPGEDGVSVAGHVSELLPDIGIVMLTGNYDRDDHLQALRKGADAFLTKPVDVDILIATLHRLARRRKPKSVGGDRECKTKSAFGQWLLDADGWCLVAPGGAVLALTLLERRLMRGLLRMPGEPVGREELIQALVVEGDVHDFDPRRLDMLVHRLRRKVDSTVGSTPPFPLLAARGVGYLFAG